MHAQVQQIYETIRDFRSDEGEEYITPERVEKWINQFNPEDGDIMRSETLRILKKRYYSKKNVEEIFILNLLKLIKKKYNHKSYEDLFNLTVFLDLQPKGKSQGTYLKLVESLSKKKLNCSINKSPHKKAKYYIYLDDILCTGNTYYQDIFNWANERAPSGKTYLSDLLSKKINIII